MEEGADESDDYTDGAKDVYFVLKRAGCVEYAPDVVLNGCCCISDFWEVVDPTFLKAAGMGQEQVDEMMRQWIPALKHQQRCLTTRTFQQRALPDDVAATIANFEVGPPAAGDETDRQGDRGHYA